ncbi:hypothetical protein WG936_05345 [Corynebacterium sp. H127]|uniref:hypothetical protein n=1 Tax=Corynebacterium sp. H127 TaxID=3133418 RepID=UPI00309B8938
MSASLEEKKVGSAMESIEVDLYRLWRTQGVPAPVAAEKASGVVTALDMQITAADQELQQLKTNPKASASEQSSGRWFR